MSSTGVETRVGPYRILRLINRGGQGRVYLGYDKRLHRRVAIKIHTLPRERSARRRLLHEAQLVASIQNPKVVQIHDVIESRGHLAMVMEYVPGCDLEEFLGEVRPSLASVLAIGADIAGALAAARQQGIVHGDLKAANVLIADTGRVKITDFGIARRGINRRDAAALAGAGGSLSALSPEQYLGQPLDVRSDLFALGCLLYRMLSGEHPFMRGGQLDTRLLLAAERQPWQDRLAEQAGEPPGELLDLVVSLLQRDPADRPANTHQVRQQLRRVSRDIPLAATGSLLQEARPLFRAESVEDMPPHIPEGLGREARSRLARPGASEGVLRQRLRGLSWHGRVALGVAGAALLALPLAVALRSATTVVEIPAPVLRVSGDMRIPAAVSGRWLARELGSAVAERLGSVRFTGTAGIGEDPRFLSRRAASPLPAAGERLQLTLRCASPLCVAALRRERGEEWRSGQVLLLSGMSEEEWRDALRLATHELYD